MRSFLTRLVDSAAGLLLIPCLLLFLACAMPPPIESLEEGMTVGTVRAEFGAPDATEAESESAKSRWTYWHEEQNWAFTFFPLTPLFIPFTLAVGDGWKAAYVIRQSVVLHFEGGELVRWEVIEPVPVAYSGYSDPFPSTMTFPTKDSRHHDKGHKHHHGHK
jgi:hypothetical protein